MTAGEERRSGPDNPAETALVEALQALLLAPDTRQMVEIVAKQPVLLTAPAFRLLATLAERAGTEARRQRIAEVSGLLSTLSRIPPLPAGPHRPGIEAGRLDLRAVHEAAAIALARRCDELRRTEPGLAWAGAIVVLGHVLHDLVSLGHEMASGRIAEVVQGAADNLLPAAALFVAIRRPLDAAQAHLARAWLLHDVPVVREAAHHDAALAAALDAARSFALGGSQLHAARARHLAGILYRDRQAGDLVHNQERGIRHLAIAWETMKLAEEFAAGAHVLFSACDAWVSRITGDPEENTAVGRQCYKAARAIWVRQGDALSVLRADYLWASCLLQRRFHRAAALNEANRLLQRTHARIAGLPASARITRLAALTASLLGEATRQRLTGRRVDNLLASAELQAKAAKGLSKDINPRDLANVRLRLSVTAIDLVEHEGQKWVRVAREAVDAARAIPVSALGRRTRLVLRFWDGLVAAYEGDWERAAKTFSDVVSERAALLDEQHALSGSAKTTELLSGLAALGTYVVYRAAGVPAALAFLAEVRRPIMSGRYRSWEHYGENQFQLSGAVQAVVVPLITPLGSVVIGTAAGRSGSPDALIDCPLPDLRPSVLQPSLEGWLRACHRARHDRAYTAQHYGAALKRLLRPLRRSLGAPLAQALSVAGVPSGALVATVPIGALTMVPLHAIGLGRVECLGDVWPLVTWPWLVKRKMRHQTRGTGSRKALVVCDPDGSLGFPAMEEAAMVCRALSAAGLLVERLDGSNASVAAIAERMAGAEVIHVISHGTYDVIDPGSSGIVAAKGRLLTARGISSRLDLSTCRLCVLSACDTGLSDPGLLADAFVGLAGAFLEAGAESVIATLWPIPNDGAASMCSAIYQFIFRDGMLPALATQAAAEELRTDRNAGAERAKPDLEAMLSWAAFITCGRPDGT